MANTRTSLSTYITSAPDTVRVVTHTCDTYQGVDPARRLLGRIEVGWGNLADFRLMFDLDSIDAAEGLAHTLLAAVDAARHAAAQGPDSDQVVPVPVCIAVTDDITTANAHTHPGVVGNPS